MSDLKILFPEPVSVDVGGKEVNILPVKLRHFDLYGKEAGALMELLGSLSSEQILRYAANHGKDLRRLLAITTDMTWWQRWRLPSTAAVQLLAEVVRVNSSFFGEALPAMVRALSGAPSSNV